MTTHTTPSYLDPDGRGRQLWEDLTATNELEPHEHALLVELCCLVDELDALRDAVKRDGVTAVGSRGQVRVHPALTALRAGAAELRRLVDALNIESEAVEVDAPGVSSLASRRASKAARVRWADRGSRSADA